MAKKKESLTVDERIEKALVPKEEQPYEIPSNWVWVISNTIFDIRDGTHDSPQYVEEGFPLITSKNLKNNVIDYENVKLISKLDLDKINERSYVEEGDILFAMIGTIGNPVIVKQSSMGTYAVKNVAIFKPYIKLINIFYSFYMKSNLFTKYIEKNLRGTTQKFVSLNMLRSLKFPLPPLEEQKRIVKKVESMLDKIKEAKEIINDVREKALLRKESLLNKAFTGELTSKWRSENKTTSATKLLEKINDEKLKKWEEECKVAESEGKKKPKKPALKTVAEMIVPKEEEPYEIPSNWVWTRLGEISELINGDRGKNYPAKSKLNKNGDIPFISASNLNEGEIDVENLLYLSEEQFNLLNSGKVEKNDLLFCLRGSLGKFAVNNYKNGAIASSLVIIRNHNFFRIENKYIEKYLSSNLLKAEIKKYDNGTAQPNLSSKSLSLFNFPLPPLEEQKEIVRILDDVLEKEREIEELCNMEENLELLEKSILDKAFRGELGTNSTDDESAIELLRKMYSDD